MSAKKIPASGAYACCRATSTCCRCAESWDAWYRGSYQSTSSSPASVRYSVVRDPEGDRLPRAFAPNSAANPAMTQISL